MGSSLGRDGSAVSAVVAVILLVAITAVLAGGFMVFVHPYVVAPRHHIESNGQAVFADDQYEVGLVGPEDVPLAKSRMLITLNGAAIERPLTDLAPQLSNATKWRVGERVCMVGPSPCLYAGAVEFALTVTTDDTIVFALPPLSSTHALHLPLFEIMPDGGIRLLEVANIRADVVGTSLNYGAGGPTIPVTARLSQNGGTSYIPLFSGLPVAAGNTMTMVGTQPGTILGIEGHAQYLNLFSATYDSVHSDPHVWVLKDGAAAPDVAPFTGQASLKSYLAPYVDTATGTMVLAPNQAILLFEFNPTLPSPAADYQDLAVLFTFV